MLIVAISHNHLKYKAIHKNNPFSMTDRFPPPKQVFRVSEKNRLLNSLFNCIFNNTVNRMDIVIKEDIKPLSLLRTDPGSVLRQIRNNRRPVIITDRGKPAAVLVPVEEYEQDQEKLALMEAVLEGEKDFQEGRTKTLDQVYQRTRQWLEKK